MIGIGAGPANLSAAALLEPLAEVRAVFYEAKERFAWHPGLLLDGATLQSPYLKDLVTLANPCSPYTFLNYLFCEKRFHRFLIANFADVTRAEFDRYFRWASTRLANLRFGRRVRAVDFRDGAFRVRFDDWRTNLYVSLRATFDSRYVLAIIPVDARTPWKQSNRFEVKVAAR